ncbi:MAG: branched-chain amino acid ABC transporter permease, partial [Candidatus Bathyarchaeia archaeon]
MVEIGTEAIVTTLLSGVVLGSLYSLMAVGLTLIFSTVRVVNFAHGSFLALGAFIAWWLAAPSFTEFLGPEPHSLGIELPIVLAIGISVVAMFGFGLFYERSVIRPVRMKPDWEMKFYFITISLLVAFENFNIFAFGATNKKLDLGITGTFYYDVFGRSFPIFSNMEILQLVVSISTLLLIFVFLKYQKQGLAMRAVMWDPETSTLLGIKLTRIFSLTFGISAMLAG